jgi:hypothetical protein
MPSGSSSTCGGLRIRLLGDRVLQNVVWKAAGLLGWPDTFDAEYVALTQLHADALITLDRHLGGGRWGCDRVGLDGWARTLRLCLILFVAAAGPCLAAVAAVLIRHIWLYGPPCGSMRAARARRRPSVTHWGISTSPGPGSRHNDGWCV